MSQNQNQNQNSKQNVSIAEVQRDVYWLKKEITEVKKQVFNHIPSKIDEINKRIDRITTGLIIGFLSTISITIIVQVVLRLF